MLFATCNITMRGPVLYIAHLPTIYTYFKVRGIGGFPSAWVWGYIPTYMYSVNTYTYSYNEGISLPLDSLSYPLQVYTLFSKHVWVQQSAHVTESQSLVSSHSPPSPLPPLLQWVELTRHADWLNIHLWLQHQHHHTKQNVHQCCREKNTCPPLETKRETVLKHEGQQ